jgi:hypothetical protein
MVARWVIPLAVVSVAACKPEFDNRNSQVTGLRILAVEADPPEAPPVDDLGMDVEIKYKALVVDATGPRPDAAVDWAYCTLPKPTSELNDTTIFCFYPSADWIKPFGTPGTEETGTLPGNGCNQFGPDVPSIPGQPPSRPADPDATGGYYQPMRLLLNTGAQYSYDLAQTRLRCNLPGATSDVVKAYGDRGGTTGRYKLNTNPIIDRVVAFTGAQPGGMDVYEGGEPLVVGAGEAITLVALWAACPTPATKVCGDGICTPGETVTDCPADCTAPKGCTGAEPYAYFDLTTRTLVDRRESIRVSWFSPAGEFRDDRTGRGEDEADITQTNNVWTAPASPGRTFIWLVIRDSRGGASWRSLPIDVQ